jgi:phage tail sheath protein FI
LDRINVRRLAIIIRQKVRTLGLPFVFEPNDPITWGLITGAVEPLLEDILARRGIRGFKVICDETTNTPIRIDRNELWIKVEVTPTKAAESLIFEINVLGQQEA